MFYSFPIHIIPAVRSVVFILNTVLLIAALIVIELIYSETPERKRQQLKYFLPLFLVLTGVLMLAAYDQVKG